MGAETVKKIMAFLDKFDTVIQLIKPRKKISLSEIKKILIVKNDKIGDAVNAAYIVSALKEACPNKEIHVLTSKKNNFVFNELSRKDVIQKRYPIDNDFSLDYNMNKNFPFGYVRYFHATFSRIYVGILKILSTEHYDLVIDLVGKRHIAVLAKISGARTIGPKIAGFTWLYDYGFERSWTYGSKKHVIHNWQDLIENALTVSLAIGKTQIPIKRIPISLPKRYILFHVGGTAIRRFETEKIIDIIKHIALSSKIVIIDDVGQNHIKEIKPTVKDRNVVFIKKDYSLPELAWIAKKANVFITFDGGHMHYLSFFRRSLVFWSCGVFEAWIPWDGSTYVQHKRYGNGVVVWKSKNRGHRILVYPTKERPCFDLGCKNRECLKNIERYQIFEAFHSIV